MSTISRERNEALDRLVQVTHHLQDDRHTLAAFQVMEDSVIFLYDDDQRSLFLGKQTQDIALLAFWEKRRQNASYCIACELMLCFDERWIAVPGEPSVELGIDTGTAKWLSEALRDEMPSLEYMDVGDL